MEMMQYKPWEKKEVNSLVSESNKKLPILDIQLGGACNLSCPFLIAPAKPNFVLSDVLSISS